MKDKPFKDVSPFSCMVQYFDESGAEWRRVNCGICWMFYRLKDDAFILEGKLNKPSGNRKIKTIREIHGWYLERQAELNSQFIEC